MIVKLVLSVAATSTICARHNRTCKHILCALHNRTCKPIFTEYGDETDDESYDDAEDGGRAEAGADVPHLTVRLVIGVVDAAGHLKQRNN